MQASGTSYLSSFLYMLAFNIPYLIVYFVGIILSFVFRKRIGKAAIFTILSLLLSSIATFISLGHSAWIYFYMYPTATPNYDLVSKTYTVIGILRTLLEIIAFILLFVAIFAHRNNASSNEPPLPHQY